MAVSLAFGVLFATVVTLGLIPCLYIAIEDSKTMMRKLIGIYSSEADISANAQSQ
jgi:hypothetical protein